MTNDEAEKILSRHLAQIMEHFDSVRVVVTRFDPEANDTQMHSYGHGNFYAQYGAVKAWVEAQEFGIQTQEEEAE